MELTFLTVVVMLLSLTPAATFDSDNTANTIAKGGVFAKPGCKSKCGNITVPYPFGIGVGSGCSIDSSTWFDINCDTSFNPPRAFLGATTTHIYNISESQIRIATSIVSKCYSWTGDLTKVTSVEVNLTNSPYFFSDLNTFTAIGCDAPVMILKSGEKHYQFICASLGPQDNNAYDCSRNGTCQIQTPKGLIQYYNAYFDSENSSEFRSFEGCSYAFLGEKASFKFRGALDLSEPTFMNRTEESVPVVLDWAIGNKTCNETQKSNTCACQSNAFCSDSDSDRGGYICSCNEGFEGNPYLSPGCQDIDECADPNKNACDKICKNTLGSHKCYCPHGYYGDGKKNSEGCIAKSSESPVIKFILGISVCIGVLLVPATTWWLYKVLKRNKMRKLKKKFFERNGGMLLQVFTTNNNVETTKIFTAKELEKATDHYNVNRIIGRGGQGTVYKGMLIDGRIVAVKKSKIEEENKLRQFINEILILSQINHRNIVKLHGCCLETEVPLLVYQYIPNGTLFRYIHDHKEDFPLAWNVRVRVAAEVAGALSYLHSAASVPVYHRDIKSENILLDDKYRAKVADFGISRSISLDKTHATTNNVQGTFGYLDPEYLQSSQYTDKSDVYSFGVILVELMTGQKPILARRPDEKGRSLVSIFLLAMEENRVLDILDSRVNKEDEKENVIAFAKLAYRCLNLEGRKRPGMKQVAAELDTMRMSCALPTADQKEKIENMVTEQNGLGDITSTSSMSSYADRTSTWS